MESPSCQAGDVEPRPEVVRQDLGLQTSPSGPGERLSHVVKEEADPEPGLGEGQSVARGGGWLLGKCRGCSS